MSDMTSTPDNSWIEAGDPFSGRPWTPLEVQRMLEEQKRLGQVRQRLAEEYSSAPLYQARAQKDPQYWNKFSIGQVR